ncbi:MAG: HAMP domain-containing sensor histidine kinase [Saprospiraceae bacterium]
MTTIPTNYLFRYIGATALQGATAAGLGYLSQSFWPALVWLLGNGLSLWILRLMQRPFPTKTTGWQHALLAAWGFVLLLLALHRFTSPATGWGGFNHLTDLPLNTWVSITALLSLVPTTWLWMLHQLQCLRHTTSDRRKRTLLLVTGAASGSLAALLPGIHWGIIPLFLSLSAMLFSLDIYLDSNRTSITWLLVWLLLFSLIMAVFAYRHSQHADTVAYQQFAQSIDSLGTLDNQYSYHLTFQWDTLSPYTAPTQLTATSINLSPGKGAMQITPERRDWVFHRLNGSGYIRVGRPNPGFRPALTLTSLFFLMGLTYVLFIRAWHWLSGFPIAQWQFPLYGNSSLRTRIQLSFFGVALIAFLLMGWFTYGFLKGEADYVRNWLEQLLSLYVFLLLIAGALGIFIANSITEPLVQIGQKLGDTRLNNNEPLHWPKDDEIGRIVSNYNRMISELEESATKLAAAEREDAWREMAKQVAHEIKNPLTPMKLQLQQLQRIEKEYPERAREWSEKVARNLIEQIDGLALIATAFSHFARLPAAQATVFDLREVAQSTHQLFLINDENVALSLAIPDTPCWVLADKDQLIRVFNNLVKNALQALQAQADGRVHIQIESDNKEVLLAVTDNGSGIPEAIRHKIFQPNFTTKSSGMGLGLALCKNIIEQANGRIQFESSSTGTTFQVHLPMVSAPPINCTTSHKKPTFG